MNERLTEFVSKQTSVSAGRLTPHTRLFHDLGLDGDDAVEFFEVFEREFAVDLSGMDWNQHIEPESAGCMLPLAPFDVLMRWRIYTLMVPITPRILPMQRAQGSGRTCPAVRENEQNTPPAYGMKRRPMPR